MSYYPDSPTEIIKDGYLVHSLFKSQYLSNPPRASNDPVSQFDGALTHEIINPFRIHPDDKSYCYDYELVKKDNTGNAYITEPNTSLTVNYID